MAWVAWPFGVLLVLIFVLIAVSGNEPPLESSASALRPNDDRRSADSVAVLALASTDTSMPRERLLVLESTLHANSFAVSHDAAHRRYSQIMMDSAQTLIGSGLTVAARGLLRACYALRAL